MKNSSRLFISPTASFKDAMACIERESIKAAIVIDQEGRLLDVITDGDLRRAILDGHDISEPVSVIKDRRAANRVRNPVSAHESTDRVQLKNIMAKAGIRQIPLLDDQDRVVNVLTYREIDLNVIDDLEAVIMAGGFGKRLMPLTKNKPKPMLEVGSKPLLERILLGLKEYGVTKIHITTFYKRESIQEYFGDGSAIGVDINYIEENQPMGTAGALSWLDIASKDLLVVNGDIMTDVDFASMVEFHKDSVASMTVGVKDHQYTVPFGVVRMDNGIVLSVEEKPTFHHFVNAGIYVISRTSLNQIPNDKHYDMTDLISALIIEGDRVVGFPIHEYWMDIGEMDNYLRANRENQ